MADPRFEGHADRARRGQWVLDDMPWDEPFKFCGKSKREQMFCRMNVTETCTAIYHFQLGNRVRLGEHMIRSWQDDKWILSCLEWHDLDEQRHLVGLRRLLERVNHVGESLPAAPHQPDLSKRMWNLGRPLVSGVDNDVLRLNLLTDEAVCASIFDAVARGCNLPLSRAFFRACADDEARHVDYLVSLNRMHLENRSVAEQTLLQARVIAHLGRLLSALRRTFPPIAGLAHTTVPHVVTSAFRSVSDALGALGPRWQKDSLARIVHTADSSAWLLWLLR